MKKRKILTMLFALVLCSQSIPTCAVSIDKQI